MMMMKSTGFHLMHSSWIDFMTDRLDEFSNLECCPDCGALSKIGALRCQECGLFHYNLQELPERDPPPVENIEIEKPDLDPSLYSLNPLAQLPETSDDDMPDPTINWFDSSTDFSIEEKSEKSPEVDS